MPDIYPSLLAANNHDLKSIIPALEPYCAGFHVDVIDQSYAPYTTQKNDLVNEISSLSNKKVWVHLMVENPLETLATFQIPPGSIITFHTETKNNKKHIVDYILAKNWQPSIAISPKTPINEIFPWVQHVYQVLVMSVEPGAAGQSFLKDTIRKLDPLIGYRATTQLPFRIAIDGGIDPISLRLLADEEIDDFAIGSAIFNSPNPVEALKILDGIVNI